MKYLLAEDIVIRGGVLRSPDELFEKLMNAEEIYGLAVLSVFIGRQLTHESLEAALRRICVVGNVRHSKIQIGRVETLTGAGFNFDKDESQGQAINHFHVKFPSPPSKSDASRFILAFIGPIPGMFSSLIASSDSLFFWTINLSNSYCLTNKASIF